MAARAQLKFARIPPRKARYLVDQVRGRSIEEATEILSFSRRRAARPLLQLLNSAIANAETAGDLDLDILILKEAYVDQGPTMKRVRPRAQGRAYLVRHRTSHITFVVDEA